MAKSAECETLDNFLESDAKHEHATQGSARSFSGIIKLFRARFEQDSVKRSVEVVNAVCKHVIAIYTQQLFTNIFMQQTN
eukprot:m.356329 g.356329  ORF g.356329 m.356329 type:complete len:80 (-) comp90162_c0_seq1:1-240(-)